MKPTQVKNPFRSIENINLGFRFKKDYEYVGEYCPECDMELYILKRKKDKERNKTTFLHCHCGFKTTTEDFIKEAKQIIHYWNCVSPFNHSFPQDEHLEKTEEPTLEWLNWEDYKFL